MIDPEILKSLWNGGAPLLLMVAVYILWRQNTKIQERYENVLERCIAALTRINDRLQDDEED